jgi:hypothetical protein
MRLYVIDKEDGSKVHLKQTASTRSDLAQLYGANRVQIGDNVYDINEIVAEASDNTAAAMALGGVVGVYGGVPGVIIGGLIGALLGKSSDDEDKERVELFNRSSANV